MKTNNKMHALIFTRQESALFPFEDFKILSEIITTQFIQESGAY